MRSPCIRGSEQARELDRNEFRITLEHPTDEDARLRMTVLVYNVLARSRLRESGSHRANERPPARDDTGGHWKTDHPLASGSGQSSLSCGQQDAQLSGVCARRSCERRCHV